MLGVCCLYRLVPWLHDRAPLVALLVSLGGWLVDVTFGVVVAMVAAFLLQCRTFWIETCSQKAITLHSEGDYPAFHIMNLEEEDQAKEMLEE